MAEHAKKFEGYGWDFGPWDAAIRAKFEKQIECLGPYAYSNFEIFKSPKGRWMAFHNGKDYGDVKVVDLESGDVVATDIYSKKEPKFYAHHTNHSMFVPSYFREEMTLSDKKTRPYLTDVTGYDYDDYVTADWDKFLSIPVAFNAWTIWAADFEFYVDLLDLRDIDNGVIKVWDKRTSFTIPISASHVRNYVKFNAEYWLKMEPKEGEPGVSVPTGEFSSETGDFTVDFNVLQERTQDRMNFNINTRAIEFSDMNKDGDAAQYDVRPELPWESLKKRIDAKS